MIELEPVLNAQQRVEDLRATVKRLLLLLDYAEPWEPKWHALVKTQVEEIHRQYPTRSRWDL